MKKSLFFIIPFCLVVASCAKDNASDVDVTLTVDFVVEPAVAESGDVATKSYMSNLEFRWSTGDRVGIYPNSGGQVYFDIPEAEQNSSSAQFDGGGWEFKKDAKYVSYFPFIPETYLDREKVPISYLGQKQTGKMMVMNSTPESLSPFDYMCTTYVQSENGSLTFQYMHVGYFWMFRLSSLPVGTYKQLTVTAPSNVFVSTGHLNLNAVSDNYTVIPDTKSNTMTILLEDIVVRSTSEDPFYIYMMGAPLDLTGKNITVSVVNSEKTQFDCVKTISKAYERRTFYGVACSSWTEVPQTIGVGIGGWDSGEDEGGTCN